MLSLRSKIRIITRCALFVSVAACQRDTARVDEARVAEAAAKRIANTRVLGPNDLQILSVDRTVGLEVIGDSVHVYMDNSIISVPATHVENVRYADGRLRFDVQGFGLKMFDVGDGTEGASFRVQDAVAFVTTVLDRQNAIMRREK